MVQLHSRSPSICSDCIELPFSGEKLGLDSSETAGLLSEDRGPGVSLRGSLFEDPTLDLPVDSGQREAALITG